MSSSSSSSCSRRWLDLPDHLLGSILRRLPFTDHLRIASVCTTLNSIITKKEHPPKPQPPWLMLLDEVRNNKNDTDGEFFSLSEKRIYIIPLPSPPICGRNCIGSSHGWLITTDSLSQTMHILNPITRTQVQLIVPPPPHHYDTISRYIINKGILTASPSSTGGGDFTILVLIKQVHVMAMQRRQQRHDNTGWIHVTSLSGCGLTDMVYHSGRLYTIGSDGGVIIWDHDDTLHFVAITKAESIQPNYRPKYLAVKDGLILLAIHMSSKQFKVVELDEEGGRWVETSDMRGNALFLSTERLRCSTMLMVATDFDPELRPNAIYFTDARYWLRDWRLTSGYRMGAFDVKKEGGGEMIGFLDWQQSFRDDPIWIAPAHL